MRWPRTHARPRDRWHQRDQLPPATPHRLNHFAIPTTLRKSSHAHAGQFGCMVPSGLAPSCCWVGDWGRGASLIREVKDAVPALLFGPDDGALGPDDAWGGRP